MLRALRALSVKLSLGCLAVAQAQRVVVAPYQQPGRADGMTAESREVLWEGDSTPGQFTVHYQVGDEPEKPAAVFRTRLPEGGHLYRATLHDLGFGSTATYRVRLGTKLIQETRFRTRPNGPFLRFGVLGDSGEGNAPQREIAYRLYQARPDFVLHTGDYVYADGLASEYRSKLFQPFNADVASPQRGAPLLRTTPVYVAAGNHDIATVNDLSRRAGAQAFWYYNSLPLNGPDLGSRPAIRGPENLVQRFRQAAGDRYPRMLNYTVDLGLVHLTVIDSNYWFNPRDSRLVKWLEAEIGSSQAPWKIVCHHVPGFFSGTKHAADTWMRQLAPTWEKLGVDVVFSGHVHNYQRSFPLRFVPSQTTARNPSGRFTVDRSFDGKTDTTPEGVLYVVSGAGGTALYDRSLGGAPHRWAKASDGRSFTARLVSDRHSYMVVDASASELRLRSFGRDGQSFDDIRLSRAAE